MQRTLIAALAVLLIAATTGDVPPQVDQAISAVTSKPVYTHSMFGIYLADQSTGQVLIDQNGEKMFDTGSIMKVFSTASTLAAYGPNYRFRTPVYRTGNVTGGTLSGNLVLVASGDFSFGLRERPNGTMAYNSLPQIDHNYASTGFPGAALVPNSHPLSVLDELAHKVRATGIKTVQGDVVIDERLFKPYDGWPDGLISPIWVNENLIDITSTPASPGQPAKLDWRPKLATYTVISKVTTVAGGTKTEPLEVKQLAPNRIEVTGQLAAGAKPLLVTAFVLHPADFARAAFIEALRRAGVSVTANESAKNPARLLPSASAYTSSTMVAQHVSPAFSQFIKVILKISYNRGADLMVCLLAVKHGSHTCPDGLAPEVKTISGLGVSQSTVVWDGAGSVDTGRTSPADEAMFLRTILSRPWGRYIHDGMSILGVDGLQATNQVGTPAAGKVRIKEGTRLITSPSGQIYFPAYTQVGYIDAKSGRQLVYSIFFNGIPTTAESAFEALMTATSDDGSIVLAIQQNY